jgi:hypothetical protein
MATFRPAASVNSRLAGAALALGLLAAEVPLPEEQALARN